MRGRTGDRTLPSTSPYMFMAVPPSRKTIGLFEWEVYTLQKKAKQLSLNIKIVPDIMFWDAVSGTSIVTQWNLDHNNCPFLSRENLCLVNDQKPLICQAYPLMAFGLLDVGGNGPKELALGDCPNAVPLPFKEGLTKLKPSVVFKELFRVYQDTFLGMLRLDAARKLLEETLVELKKEGLIRPAIVDKQVLKALLRSKRIGLLEHLENKYPVMKKSLSQSVNSIYEVDIAFIKQMLNKN